LKSQVLTQDDPAIESNSKDFLKNFTLCYQIEPKNSENRTPLTLIITSNWLYLCQERFQAYLEEPKVCFLLHFLLFLYQY